MIKRHNKFPQITGLDQEIDLVLKALEELTGRVVTTLPPVGGVNEGAKFFVKQSDNTFDLYQKIDGTYRLIKDNIS